MAPVPNDANARQPLPGRTAELAVVDEALVALAAGQGSIVAVCGEPGIGKTRLLDQIAVRAQAHGVQVFRGSALPFDRDMPFAVLADALEGVPAELPRGEITQIERQRVHRAARRLLEALGSDGPVLLQLDDLHWADPESIVTIAHLLCRWPRGPIAGVFAHRAPAPPALEGAISVAVTEGRGTRLELSPLTRADADELLAHVPSPLIRRSLYRMSGGNPFHLEELAASAEPDRIPPRVLQLVADEVAALSSSPRSLLEIGAAIGEPFEVMLAAAVAGIAERDAAPLVDDLIRSGLVRRAGTSLLFRHPIVGRAVYASMPDGRRTSAHARIVDALSRRDAPVALRAHHLERCATHEDDGVAAILEEAGRLAMRRTPDTASRWLATALRVLPRTAPPERRRGLLAALATSLAVSGDTTAGNARLDEALADRVVRPSSARADCVIAAARVHHLTATRVDVRPLLEGELTLQREDPAASELHARMSVEHWHACEWDAMADHAQHALAAARRVPNIGQIAMAGALLAVAEKERHDTAGARAHLEQAREVATALADDAVADRLEVLLYLGQAEHGLGDPAGAVHLLERGLGIAHATGQHLFDVPLTVALGLAQLALGRLEEAARSAGIATREATDRGIECLRAHAFMLDCAAATQRGRLAAAVRSGQAAARAAQRVHRPLLTAAVNWRLAEALGESGLHDQAVGRVIELCGGRELAWVMADERPRVYAVLADVELAMGRVDRAEEWVVAAERVAARLSLAPATANAKRARAALLLACRSSLAADLAIEAAATYTARGQRVDAAHASLLAGQALSLANDRERALEHLHRAHTTFDMYGAVRARDRAAQDLRALGHRVGHPRSTTAARGGDEVRSLTRRERQVAELVAHGQTNRRIAEQLALAEKTVETHLSNIFGKLGVSSRAEVAARWSADTVERPAESA
jgi:DNA-binding NarL/FixJ family response regulator